MQWLAEVCVKRPVFAWVLSLVIAVMGYASYRSLGVDRFPNIDIPFVTVMTVMPGGSATDIETEITDRIEAAVNTIGGISELRSQSAEGVSLVFVQFKLEKNVDIAAQEVRDKIAAITADFPDGTLAPVVTKIDPGAQPVQYIGVRAPGFAPAEIADITERLVVRRLENVSGVGSARVLGSRELEYHVVVDPLRLLEFGMTAAEIARAVGFENLTLPGGTAERGSLDATVRVHGRADSVEALANIPIREVGDRIIRLGDVADVVEATAEVESMAVYNGDETLVVVVRKQSGVNTVAVAEQVRERIAELRETLPEGVTVDIIRDESVLIETSTDAVTEHLILGSAFAAIVVLLFLGNLRSTLIAALAIPISVLGTFALMAAVGYTLNLITLLALALAVGIVIDDAIVVLENIWRWIDEKGVAPAVAAVEATKEIGLAVLATTISLVAIFMPIAFIAGIPGRFLSSFGITMSFAILVSLFVSFSLTPMLSARWLKLKRVDQKKGILERVVDVFYRPIEMVYMVILRFAMKARWLVVLLCVVALWSVPKVAAVTPSGFLPRNDTARFEITVRAPEGSSVVQTGLYAERIARDVREIEHVVATLTTVADDDAKTANVAHIYVQLTAPDVRELTQEDLAERVRAEVLANAPAELRTTVNEVAEISSGQSSASFQYIIAGPDLAVLEDYAGYLVSGLEAYEGAVDVDTSMLDARPEIGVFIDRDRAADVGARTVDIASTLNLLVGGDVISTMTVDGETVDVRLRASAEYRADVASMSALTVPTVSGRAVRLSDVVNVQEGLGPSQINRISRQRQVTIMCNAANGFSDGQVQEELLRLIAENPLPDGVIALPTGRTKEMAAVGQSFVTGLLLGLLFVYLVLAAQFESWLLPISILSSLPLTLPFALLSINLLGQQLDMFSMLGIFVLFGVVKKNGILQVDHTEHLRKQGMPRLEAIIVANRDRLRPILMTTVAFVAGMAPLVTSNGVGAGYSQATAGVIVGGQTMALLLTLLATPVIYSLVDDFQTFMRRLFGGTTPPTEPTEPAHGEVREHGAGHGPVAAVATSVVLASVAGGALLATPATANAQHDTSESWLPHEVDGGLSPDEAAERAVETSSGRDALLAQQASAAYAVSLARLAYTPQINLFASYTRLSPVESPSFGTLVGAPGATVGPLPSDAQLVAFPLSFPSLQNSTVMQASILVPLTDYFIRTRFQIDAAEAAADRADLDVEAVERQIAMGARLAYWQWVGAQMQRSIAASAVELVEAYRELADARVRIGVGIEADIAQADARLADTRLQVFRAESAIAVAADTLEVLTDSDSATFAIGALPSPEPIDSLPSIDALIDAALSTRQELASLEATVRAQGAQAEFSDSGMYPRVDAVADLTVANPNQRFQPQQDEFNASWSVGVQISWSPNGAIAAGPQERRAYAQLAAVEAQLASLRDDVRADVVEAYMHLHEAAFAIESSAVSLAAAEEALRLRTAAYQIGDATGIEVLDAQTQLNNARLAAALAGLQWEVAREQLRFATGEN